jgi:hypothetical protein
MSRRRTDLSRKRTDLSRKRTDLSRKRTDLSRKRTELSRKRTDLSPKRANAMIELCGAATCSARPRDSGDPALDSRFRGNARDQSQRQRIKE